MQDFVNPPAYPGSSPWFASPKQLYPDCKLPPFPMAPAFTGKFTLEDVFRVGRAFWEAKQAEKYRARDEETIKKSFLATLNQLREGKPTPTPPPTQTPTPTPKLTSPSTPTPSPWQRIKGNLDKWIEKNLPPVISWAGMRYEFEIKDYDIVGNQVWVVGYYGYHPSRSYGWVLHSPDEGESWEIQWQEKPTLFGGFYSFAVDFINETKDGWEVKRHTLY